MGKLLSFLFLFSTISAQAAETKPSQGDAPFRADGIYGVDNRGEYFQVTNPKVQILARSVAAMIPKSAITRTSSNPKNMQIKSVSLVQESNVCKEERFATQPVPASCTGFLIAPDVLVTAGHCAQQKIDCDSQVWVFDFAYFSQQDNVLVRPLSNVFSCKRIVTQTTTDEYDYAVILLDRPATGRIPLRPRTAGSIKVGESLFMMGHPNGLPMKIASGAQVRSVSSKFFVTNLDSYHGNSGSPVINSTTGLVEGILVRGDEDFVKAPTRSCNVSRVCKDFECRGEDVSKILPLIQFARAN